MENSSFLENLTVEKIKTLSLEELKILAQELRDKIISTVDENGGHLSSNLGIIETTLALYYVYDFPKDKLLFDVGHQSYAHKILSGREKEFSTIRKEGGLSGFPNVFESEFDAFSSGHAGTAISAGLGYAYSRDTLGEDYNIISIVGDGAISNGLNLEAITSANKKPKKFLVILNDNGMSISKNNNGLYKYFAKRTAKRNYINTKNAIKNFFKGNFFRKILSKTKNFIKRIIGAGNYVEEFGFKYIGDVDGNDLKEMIKVLKLIKESELSVFLHVKTKKGKGLKEAEENADLYHGVGKRLEQCKNAFSEAIGDELISLAEEDDKIVAITAAMKQGTGLYKFAERFPDRVVDVGISEEYAVTLAGGMAISGLKPIVCIYSTFLQRAYDQILHDVCIQNLPVVFCIDRAGVVGADGQSHQGVFDISFLRHIPNLTLLSPKDTTELRETLRYAISLNSPVAIRYPNGEETIFDKHTPFNEDNLWETVMDGNQATILACGGRMVKLALEVAKKSTKSIKVVNARSVKPLDEKLLLSINTPIITLEDNVLQGGFGSSVLEFYSKNKKQVSVTPFGIKDEFIKHASVESQLKQNGLDVENILKIIEKI